MIPCSHTVSQFSRRAAGIRAIPSLQPVRHRAFELSHRPDPRLAAAQAGAVWQRRAVPAHAGVLALQPGHQQPQTVL